MDPQKVKLPLLLKLKLLKQAFLKEENVFGPIGIAIMFCFSIFMAISTPLFLTNTFANILLFVLLVIFYSAALIGALYATGTFIEEEFYPWYRNVKHEYEDLALPEKKKALEEVDNILLRD